ncbi:hypothetical protein ACOME3_004597 [Neoechinorhynchus agilis]
MRIWTSEHTFDHSWETVVAAAAKKYPNPLNTSVTGVDVLDRVTSNGIIRTHRLVTCSLGFAPWAQRLLGLGSLSAENCDLFKTYGSELSEINFRNRTFKMMSRNLTFTNVVSVDEYLEYRPDPKNDQRTLLKQEAIVKVSNVPLSSVMEGLITNTINANAQKGRQAIEWVIGLFLNPAAAASTHD